MSHEDVLPMVIMVVGMFIIPFLIGAWAAERQRPRPATPRYDRKDVV